MKSESAHIVATRVPKVVYENIRKEAERRQLLVSEIVRECIRKYYEEKEKKTRANKTEGTEKPIFKRKRGRPRVVDAIPVYE